MFVLIIKPWGNQCTDLMKTKMHIEEDSENADHLNPHISNSHFNSRNFVYFVSEGYFTTYNIFDTYTIKISTFIHSRYCKRNGKHF